MPLILGTNSIKGFNISNSCRFNTNTLVSRTPSSASNRRTFTISQWVKKCDRDTANNVIFCAGESTDDQFNLFFRDDLILQDETSNSANFTLATSDGFLADNSAWYHIVVAVDTTQGTASNRVKVYLNGSQVTSFTTEDYPNQNVELNVSRAIPHSLGGRKYQDSQYANAYMAECVFIDGLQLTPASFGESDQDSGIWKPINVSNLTFGTNGYYLQFKQSGTSANSSGIGADTSGNGHHFAVDNLTALDQSIDTPTNNFCTLNPLQIGPRVNYSQSAGTFSENNLNVLGTGTADDFAGTIAVSTGKWFYEVKLLTALNHGAGFTLVDDFSNGAANASNGIVNGALQYGTIEGGSSSRIANNGDSSVSPQNNFDDDDIISFAFDIDGGTLQIYNNGSLDRTISSIPADTYIPMGGDSSSTDASLAFNFGSPAYSESGGNSDGNGFGNFSMAVPAGYFSLCTKNLAEYG